QRARRESKQPAWLERLCRCSVADRRTRTGKSLEASAIRPGPGRRGDRQPLAANVSLQLHFTAEQDPQKFGRLALDEDSFTDVEGDLAAEFREGTQLVCRQTLEQKGRPQIVGKH